jgi:membrane protein implicated in regulation of membrane protease activity
MPYALVVAGVAIVLGYLPGGFGLNPFISIVLSVAALYAVVRFIGKSPDEDTPIPAPEAATGKS